MSITWTPEDMLPRNFHSFSHEGILLGYDPLTGRGVMWKPDSARWNHIEGGTRQNLGLFTDEREAAEAYVNFCQKHGLACGPAIGALKLDETDYRQFN